MIRRAIEDAEPLPGARQGYPSELAGFAGRLDGTFVRDVLGREPLFLERQLLDGGAGHAGGDNWAFVPTELDDPVAVPAGHAWSPRDDGEPTAQRQWRLPVPAPDGVSTAFNRLQRVLAPALRLDGEANPSRQVDTADVAVAFSGGIDSALVATGYPDAPLYAVGFEGCHDLAAAREAAAGMGRSGQLREIHLTHDQLREAVPRVVAATGRTNAMDVAIALPLVIVAERAGADGYDTVAVGQGADELFGGYAKVVDPADDHRLDADTVRGAVRETVVTLPEQLSRDVPAIRATGVDVVAPFLQDRVVDAAIRLPSELLVDGDSRKVALRRFARDVDVLPSSVRTADKKALQYGTYVSRELDRLARQAGFKRRMDRHVDQYIESLIDGERR